MTPGAKFASSLLKMTILMVLVAVCWSAPLARAQQVWINDDQNNLFSINARTGAVQLIGVLQAGPIVDEFTDIAFGPNGELWGITRTSLYRIDPNTAQTAFVGFHGVPYGNALTFDHLGKTLYAAGFLSQSLYVVDTATGAARALPGSMGASSAGDLAFLGDTLYLSSADNTLVRLDVTLAVSGTVVGRFGVDQVYGLVTDDTGRLIAAAGQSLYIADGSTSNFIPLMSYGLGLGRVNGAASLLSGEAPARRSSRAICNAPSTPARNAAIVTHGTESNAAGWVLDMAKAICVDRSYPPAEPFPSVCADSLTHVCQAAEWDVWVVDWRTGANNRPWTAYREAQYLGETVGALLVDSGYEHLHFLAHSAGSNLIHNATDAIREYYRVTNLTDGPSIHETYFDPYDLRQGASTYGLNADYADSYVDTRRLDANLYGDFTRLLLSEAFTIDVSPPTDADPCDELSFFDTMVCRHSRPYRFYGSSIDPTYLNGSDYERVDPIGSTAGMGYPSSVESGRLISLLVEANPPRSWCRVIGDRCLGGEVPPGNFQFDSVEPRNVYVDATVGAVAMVPGGTGFILARLALGAVSSQDSASAPLAHPGAADVATEAPSWIAVHVTTAEPVDTLRYVRQFSQVGEGFLRVYVDGTLVRELDQRNAFSRAPVAETIHVGNPGAALAPGLHRIVFRLDGFGIAASGIAVTDVQLGRTVRTGATLNVPCAEFADVDGGSAFCGSIEWLRNRSVTRGCTSASQYCPGSDVNRLAMAAFMERLGQSLSADLIWQEESLSFIDLETETVVCRTTEFQVTGFPRYVLLDSVFGGKAVQTTGFSASSVISFDGGSTWLPLTWPPRFGSAPAGHFGSVREHASVDLYVGQAVRFGIKVRRGGLSGAADLNAAECQLRATVSSRGSPTSPL